MRLTVEEQNLAKLSLNQAIDAHLAWGSRLKSVLDGISTERLDVNVVSQDNCCILGKWIYGPAQALYGHFPEWDQLRVAHARFHLFAGEVLQAHQQGHAVTVETLLNDSLAQASEKTTDALVKLFALTAKTNPLSELLHFDAGAVKKYMVWYTLAILTAIVFIAETVVQVLATGLPLMPVWYGTILNASLISLFVFPVIYFQVVRPLMASIKAQKIAEENLRISAVAFEANQSTMVLDVNQVVLKVNRAYIETTGYSESDVIGQVPKTLESNQQDAAFYAAIKDQTARTGKWSGEILSRRKNGQVYLNHMFITAVYGADGVITHYVVSFTDLTEQKATEKEINNLVFYDVLTGLPNRKMLMERLQQAIANSVSSHRQDALLYIDLDNFKTLNDAVGHGKGDLLLQQVATRIRACIRNCDFVARLGGDEFVVILEVLQGNLVAASSDAELIAKKILASLGRPYKLADYNFQGSASIGIALFSGQEEAVDDLLKRADLAMYQAKDSGRNTLRFYDPEMQAIMHNRVVLEADLRRALVGNQLELYFQPQVNSDGHIIGAEALIRWNHPSRGLVSPFDFIAIAEEVGLILSIGQWVLEAACIQLKAWENNALAKHLQLAVNVSPLQFRQPDFVDQVTNVLEKNNIDASYLKIELTESMMFDNIDDTIIKMQKLKKVGVRFSMDDFGTGYSSLSYLTRLPLDQLKIDQSFVRNIGVQSSDAIIVQTIIGMTHNLGMTVIAEGVETETQRVFLEHNGCLNYQGFLFGRPVSMADFDKLLTEQNLIS